MLRTRQWHAPAERRRTSSKGHGNNGHQSIYREHAITDALAESSATPPVNDIILSICGGELMRFQRCSVSDSSIHRAVAYTLSMLRGDQEFDVDYHQWGSGMRPTVPASEQPRRMEQLNLTP